MFGVYEMKNILLSRTVIGAFIQIFAAFLTAKGLLQDNELENIMANLDAISGAALSIIGLVVTVYGRLKAKKKIFILHKNKTLQP